MCVCVDTTLFVFLSELFVFLYYCLKSGRVMLPALFFFHVNFGTICSSSLNGVMDNLIGIALNL